MSGFRALLVERATDADGSAAHVSTRVDVHDSSILMPGNVTIDVTHSSINYKDGLAIAGRPGVIREYPLIPGIDLVGTVATSEHPDWAPGDPVLLNGWGIGETHHGGLAERARVNGDWLIALPDGMSAARAAAIGTAGFTAMLAVLVLEKYGLPDGDILVTGAAGGVGSIAVAILASLGHRVVASTGRPSETGFLTGLGAAEVIHRSTLTDPGRPLQTQRWAGAIDAVGSHTLANVLAQTRYGGIVAACGLAQGADLPASVMPFILRSVTLAGINSVQTPAVIRTEAWRRLTSDLDVGVLDGITTTIGLADAGAAASAILDGTVRGRTVVDVRR